VGALFVGSTKQTQTVKIKTQIMKLKSLLTAFVIMLSGMVAFANNIQVSNVSLTGRDVNNDFTMVKFNLSWENSWRTSSTPSNWDAAWVFVKYRVNGGNWQHAFLNNNGHSAATGSTLDAGLLTPSASFNATTNPGLGVYVYRNADGSGNVNFNDIQVRWNYGANGVADNDIVDVEVYAIEMVYVPSGSFYVGSGGTFEAGQFTNGSMSLPLQGGGSTTLLGASAALNTKTITLSGAGASTTNLQVGQVINVITGTGRLGGVSNYDTVASIINSTSFTVRNFPAIALVGATLQVNGPTIPYQITSEGSLTIDNAAGALYATSANNSTTIGSAPQNPAVTLAAAFPKGFAAFYCMKYEISQAQYVDFLNSLTRTQQAARIGTNISGTSITNRFVMSNSATALNRNGIRCNATIPATSSVTFYNDLDADGIANESNDGQNIAANYLSGTDYLTFLDWSCMRLMSELEFEKACRGTDVPVINAYAWGTASGTAATAITNSGTATEGVTPSSANMHANNVLQTGPIRVGAFATSTSTRIQSGATIYGIQDMSGNLWERTAPVGLAQGRLYTGVHGNGAITAAGVADVSLWPTISNPVLSFRGGSFSSTAIPNLMISDRTAGVLSGNTRTSNFGGRGVRTAQ
jgi:formylglycine-generating enzyme required for sulfatase activity